MESIVLHRRNCCHGTQQASVQRWLPGFQNWTSSNLMKFNKERCRALFVAQSTARHLQRLQSNQWSSSPDERDPQTLQCMPGWTWAALVQDLHMILLKHLIPRGSKWKHTSPLTDSGTETSVSEKCLRLNISCDKTSRICLGYYKILMFLYYTKSMLSLFTINFTDFTCHRIKVSEWIHNYAWKSVTWKLEK